MSGVIPYTHTPDGLDDGSELTHLVERIETLEDLCGVKLSGLCAYRESFNALGHTSVKIMGELSSFIGHVLDGSLTVECMAYNSKGQVIGQGVDHFFESSYRGMAAIDIRIECRDDPVRFVIFPRK